MNKSDEKIAKSDQRPQKYKIRTLRVGFLIARGMDFKGVGDDIALFPTVDRQKDLLTRTQSQPAAANVAENHKRSKFHENITNFPTFRAKNCWIEFYFS